MRVRVIKSFRDKHTNTLHQIGQEIEVTKERFEELNSTSFGVFVEEIIEGEEVLQEEAQEANVVAPAKKKTTRKNG